MPLTWKKTWQILIVIVLLGAGLRLYGLGNNSFVADEFLDINSSYGYLKTGEWKSWDFNFGKPAEMNINDARDERAFLYKWQVAQLFRFLPPTEGVARSVSALWGVFTIVLMFWTGWFYTRKKTVGLLAAFLFAVSISGIIFDRRLRMYAMFFPVYLAFATALYAFFETEYQGKIRVFRAFFERFSVNAVYALPVLVLGALSFHIHQLSVNIAPMFGAYLLWQALVLWKDGKEWKNKYVFTLLAGIAGAAALLSFSASARKLLFGGALVWFDNHYSYFGYALTDFAHPFLGALLTCFGAYTLWKTLGRKKETVWLVFSFLVPFVMAVWFWRRNAGPQYIFFAQAFLLLLAAIGVYGVLRFVRIHASIFGTRAVSITLFLCLLLIPNYGYFFQENNTYHETSSGGNPNYRKVFSYFKKYQEAGDALITRNFRNYYFSGAAVDVYDFGGELSKEKFSLVELETILARHPHGWVIVATNDYDYISNDAEEYFQKHMERVSNTAVRGDIEVYRW